MHTVRNRLATRPPVAVPFVAAPKAPNLAATRLETPSIRHRSMAVPLAIPDESGLIEERRKARRNPKGKKARKAAARKAAAKEASALEPVACETVAAPVRAKPVAKKSKAKTKPRTRTAKRRPLRPEQLPAIPAASPVMGTFSVPTPKAAQQPVLALALPLPAQHEPLVELEPEGVLSLSQALRQMKPDVAPQKLQLQPPSELRMDMWAAPAEPEAVIVPTSALAAVSADAPLPRARALVPARRQGLIDVIAFLLRDSGRRLARWSARRHKTREERTALRRAEARQINLQRELEALDILRRAKG